MYEIDMCRTFVLLIFLLGNFRNSLLLFYLLEILGVNMLGLGNKVIHLGTFFFPIVLLISFTGSWYTAF